MDGLGVVFLDEKALIFLKNERMKREKAFARAFVKIDNRFVIRSERLKTKGPSDFLDDHWGSYYQLLSYFARPFGLVSFCLEASFAPNSSKVSSLIWSARSCSDSSRIVFATSFGFGISSNMKRSRSPAV